MKPQAKLRSWIWFTALLLLFLAVSYFSISPKQTFYPAYVSTSPSPTGVKALYTYLKQEKDVKRWNHSPDLLPKHDKEQMLLMVEPAFIPEEDLMQSYLDYMKAGHTILLFQQNPKGMFDLNTEPINAKRESNGQSNVISDQNHTAYHAEIPSPIRLQPVKKDEILLHDQEGTIALKRSYGKGQLIVAITPDWLTNDKLLKKDHLPLVFHLLNEENTGSLLFDEYIHGGENASTFLTVYPRWFLSFILQGLLLLALWLWYKGKRFGPIFHPREDSVRFSDEGIQALAAWYQRGKRYQDSLKIQADYVKLLLQERWQVPYSKEWHDLSSNLERRWVQIPAREIQPFLNGLIAILEKEDMNKQEYLLWSRKLEELRKEVEA